MFNFRYYALGHSYLKHGPFKGWQETGNWGMAASEECKDYFHRFQARLKDEFDCNIEAIAENQSSYERLCVEGVTKEEYMASSEYKHMKEVIENFKPNIISVFLGGGNTIANDTESLTKFYDVLFEMISKSKLPETVVICPALNKVNKGILKPVVMKYGFVLVDVSFIHDKKGYDNPYYAFRDYPEYDEMAAKGAVEFRRHPNNSGHDKIAESMCNEISSFIREAIPEGEFQGIYEFEKYIVPDTISRFSIMTNPDLPVEFHGFNVKQNNGYVSFNSSVDTGASVAADSIKLDPRYKMFFVEMSVQGNEPAKKIKLELTTESEVNTYFCDCSSEDFNRYEFNISDVKDVITSFRISPDILDCMIKVKALGFVN